MMPLTQAQIEFIDSSIEHLLDFPTETDKLATGIFQLIYAVKKTPTISDDNNIFFALAKCFKDPENYFPRLENFGSEATILDVKLRILELIDIAFSKATEKNPHQRFWEKTYLISQYIDSQPDRLFKTTYTAPPFIPPFKKITAENSIFQAEIDYDDDESPDISLTVHVLLPGEYQEQSYCKHLAKRAQRQHNDDDYDHLCNNIARARRQAQNIAAQAALGFLIKKEIFPDATDITKTNFAYFDKKSISLNKLNHSTLFQTLLSNRIIIEMLLDKKISFDLLYKLKRKQLYRLTTTTAQIVITDCNEPVEAVLNLPSNALAIMRRYLTLLIDKKIRLSDFECLISEDLRILKHPTIINLIHKGKLKISEAIQLSDEIYPLLNKELYAEFFLSDECIHWPDLYTLNHIDVALLLVDQIAYAIKNKYLTINTVAESKVTFNKILKYQTILILVCEGYISYHECKKARTSSYFLVSRDPGLQEAIKCKWINFSDIKHDMTLESIAKQHYVNRINHILTFKRHTLSNGRADSMPIILAEISQLNDSLKQYLNDDVLPRYIIDFILISIDKLELKAYSPHHHVIFKNLKDDCAKHSADNLLQLLGHLVGLIDTYHSKHQTHTTLFGHTYTTTPSPFIDLKLCLNQVRCLLDESRVPVLANEGYVRR